METAVLALFAASLAACLASGLSILWALLLGFILFFTCGLRRHTARDMFLMAWNGVKTVRSVLFIFLLIGVITALWRACGTIPAIVSLAVPFCGPQWMVLASFLLCAAVSFLTGTSFGTAATMGVICAALADSMGVPALYIGGAVLSGSFFGDRWSPMSTSALLVAALTKTKLYDNLPLIWRTGLAPLLIACAAFGAAGALLPSHSGASAAAALFAASFDLHPAVLLPAAAVLLLSLLRVNVKTAMAVSILLAAALAVCLQHVSAAELLRMASSATIRPDGWKPSSEAAGSSPWRRSSASSASPPATPVSSPVPACSGGSRNRPSAPPGASIPTVPSLRSPSFPP